jgi:small subunit ribosomal protein S3
MGQKVNPKAHRLGVNKTWGSKWFSHKNYIPQLRQDQSIKKFLMKRLKEAGIAEVEIERGPAKLVVNVHVVKPGLVIGKNGSGIDEIKNEVKTKILNKQATSIAGKIDITLNVKEVDNPNLNAQVVMDGVIADLERRMPYRRVMKQAIQRVERAGAKGVKVLVAGRLNGSDIARTEHLSTGQLPLQTLRADIDYARGAASTMYGQIGVKVWIYRGEVFNRKGSAQKEKAGSVVTAKKKD